jgi:hypothetical protein
MTNEKLLNFTKTNWISGQVILLLAIGVILLEALGIVTLFQIGPFTLGKWLFILIGGANSFAYFSTPIRSSFYFIFFSFYVFSFLGGIFGSQDLDVVSNSLGELLLLFAAPGMAQIFLKNEKVLNGVFFYLFCGFLYWISSISTTLFLNSGVSYSQLYGEEGFLNHHIPGFYISVLGMGGYFYLAKIRNSPLFGYLLFIFSLVLCVYMESRSNSLVMILSVLYVNLKFSPRTKMLLVFNYILISLLAYMFIDFVGDYLNLDVLRTRFLDKETQIQTNQTRSQILENFTEQWLANPFGLGIKNTFMTNDVGNKVRLHNTYLTLLMGGGYLVIFSLILFLRNIFRLALSSKLQKQTIIFVITLTAWLNYATIELFNLFYFLTISFFIYSDIYIKNREKVNLSLAK